jgi:hypothetical protein
MARPSSNVNKVLQIWHVQTRSGLVEYTGKLELAAEADMETI